MESTTSAKAVEVLKKSRLISMGGYQVVSQLFNKYSIEAMYAEATRLFVNATNEVRDTADTEEWRGGVPPRKLLSAAGGPSQDWLYRAEPLAALLSEIVGTTVRASSNRASYSYYCREGDYLGLHRDVERCDISVIIAVSDNTDPKDAGGELIVYPEFIDQPLSAIRNNPKAKGISLKLSAGETCVIAGGMVPHLVKPVVKGQFRITAPMCFQVAI